jgi:hypothetical protein
MRGLSPFTDFDAVGAEIAAMLRGQGAILALDALGSAPLSLYDGLPSGKELVYSPARASPFDPVTLRHERLRDLVNRLQSLWAARLLSDAGVSIAMLAWLGYQLEKRTKVGAGRGGAEYNLRLAAAGKLREDWAPANKMSPRLVVLAKLLEEMERAARLAGPAFNRTDPTLPPPGLVDSLFRAPAYLKQFEPETPPSYQWIIGVTGERWDSDLGQAGAIGAFSLVLHRLTGAGERDARFTAPDLDELITELLTPVFRVPVNLTGRAVAYRRSEFLRWRATQPKNSF